MKKITLKALLMAAMLGMGGNCVSISAQDVWTFSNTDVWGNMTSNGKSSNYKEISTGSEVWFTPDGNTATSATSNVSFKFASGDGNAEGARFNYGGTNYLGIQKNYDSSNDINYVKIIVPNKYRVTIEVHTGSTGRPIKVNLDGTETSYTADATYDYTNETGNTQTIKVYATNAKDADWKTNSVKTITLIDTQTAATHSWTANAIANINGTSTIIKAYTSTGDVMEGVDYTVVVDKVIEYNGAYYVLNDAAFTTNVYSVTYTMGTVDGSHTFNYDKIDNFAFYGEAENIVSSSKNGSEEGSTLLSNGKGYVCQASSGFVTFAFSVPTDGLYHIALGMNNINNRERGFNYAIDDAAVSETFTVAINAAYVQEIDQVLAAGDHTITLNITYSRTPVFDYLLITKTADANVSASITSAGYSTYCSPYALDLDNISGGTAFYASAANESSVTLTQATGPVAAGTGLILKGVAEATVTIPVAASGDAIDGNLLVGCPTATTINNLTDGYANFYVFSVEDAEFQNLKAYIDAGNSVTIPAGKAYLNAAAGLTAKLRVIFESEDATAITAIEATEAINNGVIYNLSGQRVVKPLKGIYIQNGKKILVK